MVAERGSEKFFRNYQKITDILPDEKSAPAGILVITICVKRFANCNSKPQKCRQTHLILKN